LLFGEIRTPPNILKKEGAMALVQIRVKCERVFRDCPERCWGCKDAQVVEVKNLSGKPPKEVIEERLKQRANGNRPERPEFPGNRARTDGDVRDRGRGHVNSPRVTTGRR
jgi:hypothetical protein